MTCFLLVGKDIYITSEISQIPSKINLKCVQDFLLYTFALTGFCIISSASKFSGPFLWIACPVFLFEFVEIYTNSSMSEIRILDDDPVSFLTKQFILNEDLGFMNFNSSE